MFWNRLDFDLTSFAYKMSKNRVSQNKIELFLFDLLDWGRL